MSAYAAILEDMRSIAIVGYSSNPERPSHWIANYLVEQGYRVYRVNPQLESTDQVAVFADLDSLPETVDVVDIFRAPPHVPAIVEAAAAHQAKVVWLQPGAENEDAAESARELGMQAVVGACLYAEHKQWKP